MKKQGYKQVCILGGICILFYFLFLSTKPVSVYRTERIQTYQTQTSSKAETNFLKPDSSWQWISFFQNTGKFVLLGMAAGALAGSTDKKIEGVLPRMVSGALAGLFAGICLGVFIHVWEFKFGNEILNNMYLLPERAMDFNRE